MSATMDNIRNDARKPPEELEREADDARNAVEGTLEALEMRLSPGQMLDRAMEMVKEHGGEFGGNLLTQVRNNPLPTIMAGIGVAWLMTASKRPPPRASRSAAMDAFDGEGYDGYDDESGMTERWSSAYGSAKDSMSSAYGSARDSMSSTFDSAKDSMSSTFHSARDTMSSTFDSTLNAARGAMDSTASRAHDAADAAQRAAYRMADATRQKADSLMRASRMGADSVSQGYTYLLREQPLVLGAIAIAAGAALGALLPSTQAEDEWIGETSDEAKARIKREAESRASEIRDKAVEMLDEAVEAVESAVAQEDDGSGSSQAENRAENGYDVEANPETQEPGGRSRPNSASDTSV
jgi:ElaB/YqjD/DUF883 family membrane-anchored ribosome-binding protein